MQNIISSAEVKNLTNLGYFNGTAATNKTHVWSTFIDWCDGQERNRMLWLALAFLGMIGLAVPITLSSILFLAGNNFTLWIAVCAFNVPVLAINLAAQPTKITLPALFIAWAVDAAIILYCIAFYLLHI